MKKSWKGENNNEKMFGTQWNMSQMYSGVAYYLLTAIRNEIANQQTPFWKEDLKEIIPILKELYKSILWKYYKVKM